MEVKKKTNIGVSDGRVVKLLMKIYDPDAKYTKKSSEKKSKSQDV